MSTTVLQAPARRTQRLRYSWSPRLFLSELLLKQWFEPVIPFTVMIALAVYFSLTIKDYGTSSQRAVADAAVRRIRLRRARHGLYPDLGRHRPQRRRDLRRLQFHRPLLPVRARIPRLAHGSRHAADGRRHRRRQWHPDRLSQGAAVPHHFGDADHPARRRQPAGRALRHRLRHQLDRQRRLGLSRRGQHSGRAGQRGDADRSSSLSVTFS